jgi:(E)-4-hydroxy-3-methylbut-2-enyl-diphosphate synthase
MKTKKIRIGDVYIGGGEVVRVQSMTKTDTRDWRATAKQINGLAAVGCEIIRAAVPDMEAAKAISKIKANIKIPLVADIHFDWRLAVEAIKNGADKIRINPGNIGGRENLVKIIEAAKERHAAIRVGVNAGSLKFIKKSVKWRAMAPAAKAAQMCKELFEYIGFFEDLDFTDLVISLKAADVMTTVLANRIYANSAGRTKYPIHLGITEAGTEFSGLVKSSAAFGILLSEGIGDTIRVSMTADPACEVKAGWEILKSLGLRKRGVGIISCPTCSRCETDLIKIVHQLENKLVACRLSLVTPPIKVAVMGCIVNGPGEAKDADIGIAGGKGFGLLFKKGRPVEKIPQSKWVERIISEIKNVQKKIQ